MQRLESDSAGARCPCVRDAARAMVADGELDVTQKGEVVDLDAAKGPIRLRRR